jgi:hypothetical protein
MVQASVMVRAEVLNRVALESDMRENSPDYERTKTLASSCDELFGIPDGCMCVGGIRLEHPDGTTCDKFDKVFFQILAW